MKRVLLSFILLCLFSFSYSQLSINEVYLEPGCGTLGQTATDYIELYNGTGSDINLDCYKIVVYFKQKQSEGGSINAYVFDLPNKIIKENGLFVFAGLNQFCVQGGGLKSLDLSESGNGYNWNAIPSNSTDASLTSYVYIVDNDVATPGNQSVWKESLKYEGNTDLFDLLAISNNTEAAYNIFLVSSRVESNNSSDKVINSLLFGYNSTYPPLDVTSLLPLPQVTLGDCNSDGTIIFSQIKSNEKVAAASGSDNGYFREFNGLCGTWKKAASPTDHTPGVNNNAVAPPTGAGTFDLSTGTIACNGNNPFSATIYVTSAEGSPYPISYRVYRDVAPYSSLTSPSLSKDDVQIGSGTYGNTDNQNSFQVNNLLPGETYLIQAVNAAGCYSTLIAIAPQACAVQPVTFSNFHAQRSKQTVALKWETASEQNNRGFNVQRNTRGAWETVAFVFSAANGGNSDQLLSYSFNDPNSEKGVSQYRIQQVDLDGKASYSAIRSVKGLEQAGTRTVVYPNPSQDGKVSVVFDDQAAKAVTVSDMSGRVVRQYRNVLNNLSIEGLESGMYSIQITDLSSAVSTTEKVIIKKR